MRMTIKPINENSLIENWFFNKVWSYRRFNKAMCQALDNRIVAGFAKGMKYVSSVPWTRLIVNRLVGTYEMELLPFFQSFDSNPPKNIFDIGAAEGYYAIGSLVRWKNAEVLAWETDEKAANILQKLALENKVSERLQTQKTCTVNLLKQSLKALQPELIIMDIEGAESEICVSGVIELGRNSSWVIECHSREILEKLQQRFQNTHQIEIIPNRNLSLEDVKVKLPWLFTLFPQDRWRIVREGRVIATPWLIARPKSKKPTL